MAGSSMTSTGRWHSQASVKYPQRRLVVGKLLVGHSLKPCTRLPKWHPMPLIYLLWAQGANTSMAQLGVWRQIHLSEIIISSCKDLSSIKLTNRGQKALEGTGHSWKCGFYFLLFHVPMSAVPIGIREIVIMLWRVNLREEGEQLILETKILQLSLCLQVEYTVS